MNRHLCSLCTLCWWHPPPLVGLGLGLGLAPASHVRFRSHGLGYATATKSADCREM